MPEGRLWGGGGSLTQFQDMPGPGRAWAVPGPGGGPWSAQNFVDHQLSQVKNFWSQRRPAVFRLESRSDGLAQLSLTFQLPTIPPPPPSFPTPTLPTSPPSLRPIIPLFPQGEAPKKLSSKQRRSHQRSVLHRAASAATNPPPDPQATQTLPPHPQVAARVAPNPPQHPEAAPTFPPLQEAVTRPTPPLPQRKRPRSSSLPSSPASSPVTLSQRLRQDFNLESEEESASPSPKLPQPLSPPATPLPGPSPENLREAFSLRSPLSLSLDPTTPQSALPSPPTLNLTPSSPPVLPLETTSLDQGDALLSPQWQDEEGRKREDFSSLDQGDALPEQDEREEGDIDSDVATDIEEEEKFGDIEKEEEK